MRLQSSLWNVPCLDSIRSLEHVPEALGCCPAAEEGRALVLLVPLEQEGVLHGLVRAPVLFCLVSPREDVPHGGGDDGAERVGVGGHLGDEAGKGPAVGLGGLPGREGVEEDRVEGGEALAEGVPRAGAAAPLEAAGAHGDGLGGVGRVFLAEREESRVVPLGLPASGEEEAVEVPDGFNVGRGGRQGGRGELGAAEHAVAGGPVGLGGHGGVEVVLVWWDCRGIG